MIEQMTHVAVIGKAADKDGILSLLYDARDFHPMPIGMNDGEADETWEKRFAVLPDESQPIDGNLARVNSLLSFCQEHRSEKPGFLDAMLPLKVIGTKAEIPTSRRACRLCGGSGAGPTSRFD